MRINGFLFEEENARRPQSRVRRSLWPFKPFIIQSNSLNEDGQQQEFGTSTVRPYTDRDQQKPRNGVEWSTSQFERTCRGIFHYSVVWILHDKISPLKKKGCQIGAAFSQWGINARGIDTWLMMKHWSTTWIHRPHKQQKQGLRGWAGSEGGKDGEIGREVMGAVFYLKKTIDKWRQLYVHIEPLEPRIKRSSFGQKYLLFHQVNACAG